MLTIGGENSGWQYLPLSGSGLQYSLFHDERQVREAAFQAVKHAVDEGWFRLVEETFFNSPKVFENFADFENRILNVTHTRHTLDDELYDEVKQRYEAHMTEDGARFLMPIRVDLLEKPGR